jgi:prepilin-type N-terminal cleavage/methylation domain-containing protein
MKKFLPGNQRGDTIVEVLIAVALLAVILTGAYVTSNNSLRAERDSQEHAEAVTLAQAQIESLESLALQNTLTTVVNPASPPQCLYVATGVIKPFTPVQPHCYIPSNNPTVSPPLSAVPTVNAAPYYYDITLTANTSKSVTVSGTNSSGHLVLATVPLTTYGIQVIWPSLNGGTDSVQLYYRPN